MTLELDRIYQGDALAAMRVWPAGIANTIVTSPPYWGLRDYGIPGQRGLEPTPDEYVAGMVEVFREARRVLKDDGTLWLNLGDSYAASQPWRGPGATSSTLQGGKEHQTMAVRPAARWPKPGSGLKPKDLVGIPWAVAFALRADGWYLRADVIWAKKNCMPESVSDRPTKAHEYIFLLAKSDRYYYDAEAIMEPVAEITLKDRVDTGKNRDDRGFPGKASAGGGRLGDKNFRNKRTVWHVATQPFKEAHFATFPPNLIAPCVLAGSPRGGVVLDPFMGAGTTALVAARYDRRFIGCELNPEYIKIAEARVASERAQEKLL